MSEENKRSATTDRDRLRSELEFALEDIDRQIEIVKTDAFANNQSARLLKDTHGNYILTPLLVAKAQCLSALVELKNKGVQITNYAGPCVHEPKPDHH